MSRARETQDPVSFYENFDLDLFETHKGPVSRGPAPPPFSPAIWFMFFEAIYTSDWIPSVRSNYTISVLAPAAF